MAATLISDIIVPEVFNPYVTEKTAELSDLIASGIVVNNDRLNAMAAAGGKLIRMPFFKDLTGTDEVLADDADLTVNAITTSQTDSRLHLRGKAWGVHDLAEALSGADPMADIGDKVAAFWARMMQAVLINSLQGVFADNLANDASDLLHVVAQEEGSTADATNKISGTAVLDAKNLLGDAAGSLVAIGMHSNVYTELQKQNLITFIPNSRGEVVIPTYLGYRVIVDDGCFTRVGTTDGFVTRVYLFAAGAVGMGDGGAPTPTETDRDSLGSTDILIMRRHFVMHPFGFNWEEDTCAGEAPTNAECALAANWDRKLEKKNCGVVALDVNP